MENLVFLTEQQLIDLYRIARYYGHFTLKDAILCELAERAWMTDYDHYRGN